MLYCPYRSVSRGKGFMRHQTLSKWLRLIIAGAAVCGLIIHALIVPAIGQKIALSAHGEFRKYYWPWLIFIWVTGAPCYAVLVLIWKVAQNIGLGQAFSPCNAKLLKWVCIVCSVDSLVFLAGNAVFLLLGMSRPAMALFSLLIIFAGFSIAVASAVLSHSIKKALDLHRQSDLNI